MKPSSSPGNSRPSPPSHKLELQTLKLEELTVGLICSVPGSQCHLFFRAGPRPHRPMARELGQSVWILAPLSFLVIVPPELAQHLLSLSPPLRSQSFGSSCAYGDSQSPGPSRCSWSACAVAPRPENGRSPGMRTKRLRLPGRALGLRLWGIPGGLAR